MRTIETRYRIYIVDMETAWHSFPIQLELTFNLDLSLLRIAACLFALRSTSRTVSTTAKDNRDFIFDESASHRHRAFYFFVADVYKCR